MSMGSMKHVYEVDVSSFLAQAELERQQQRDSLERQDQDHRVGTQTLEEKNREAENQIKDLKETIYELEDQVEQRRAVQLHTNQTIVELESMIDATFLFFFLF